MEIRILNVILGVWLFASAFVWDHAPAQRVNTWIAGLLCTIVALVATRFPPARWVNAVLGVWVFASIILLPRHGSFGLWNNLLVGAAIFFIALAGTEEDDLRLTASRRRATA